MIHESGGKKRSTYTKNVQWRKIGLKVMMSKPRKFFVKNKIFFLNLIIHSEFFSYNSDCFCIPAREILIFHYSYFVLKTVTFWQLEQKVLACVNFFPGSVGVGEFAVVLLWLLIAVLVDNKLLVCKMQTICNL